MMHIRNSLPDTIKVQRVEERLSGTVVAITDHTSDADCERTALGNVILCNDYVVSVLELASVSVARVSHGCVSAGVVPSGVGSRDRRDHR